MVPVYENGIEDMGSIDCCVAACVETWEGRGIEAGRMDCWVMYLDCGAGDGREGEVGAEDDEGGSLVGIRVVVASG